jgi:DNA repair exonuclease SbcCD nuclease subunit
MKLALLGDTHLGARGDSAAFHDHMQKFYMDFFFPYLKEHGISTVIQLGDLFDRRKYINFMSLHRSRSYLFDQLSLNDINFHVFPGNHDTFYKSTNEINSIDLLLGEYSNITTYMEPTEASFDGLKIGMIPWICPENYDRVTQFMNTTSAQIVLGHFEIAGFEMYRGSVCDHGLSIELFQKFDEVYSGHFHTRSSRGNITYVGTPYELTWSDWNDPKGFHILDTETRELTFVENPYKMFHKIHYDDSSNDYEQVMDRDLLNLKNGIIKVVVHTKNNPYWFDQFISKIEKIGVVDLQIVDDHLNLDLEDDSDIAEGVEDTLTVLTKYAEQVSGVDQRRLNSFLTTLYHEASNLE